MLLSKGFEIELYTGTPQGDVVGLSDRIVGDLDGFVREPDSRNVEYTTAPLCCYDRLLCALLRPRGQLRNYLQQQGNYTLIPGSTLSLGDTSRFYRSNPHNPYHSYIEKSYGTNIVTTSVHINIGIRDMSRLMQACRLVRVEAPLYLALSASSPFLDGRTTGYHSTRWGIFPKTPARVPLFASHHHFIKWTEAELEAGRMKNVRHLWCSVRPNGDRRPYDLNRLELRICDLMENPLDLLAVTAFLEARLFQLSSEPSLDPLYPNYLPESTRAEDLIGMTDENEEAAARLSLDAQLTHWQDGRKIIARDWIWEIYQQVLPIAKRKGFSCFLHPLKTMLISGNLAQKWLRKHHEGLPIRHLIQQQIQMMKQQEQMLEKKLCEPLAG